MAFYPIELEVKCFLLVYQAIKQFIPKKIQKLTWRMMYWMRYKKDPLTCPKCNIEMRLSGVYYGLSPPMLMIRIHQMLYNLGYTQFLGYQGYIVHCLVIGNIFNN